MTRFWLRFDPRFHIPAGFKLGCGVTARSREDALGLLRSHVPAGPDSFKILEVVPDIELDGLDPGHILPNIGDTFRRGVWFPNFGPAKDG